MSPGSEDARATLACDVVVIGAGVVGLAVARAFAIAGRDVVVLEAAAAIGAGASSRNSEVVHSGLYYPRGSLKAEACVEGRERLYAFCDRHGVAYRRCGKLIVLAPTDARGSLLALERSAKANGVDDLVVLAPADVSRLEPDLVTAGALLSPSTGIVDSHGFMLALRGDLEEAGGMIAFETPVVGGSVRHGLALRTGGATPAAITTRLLVNAAGLGAGPLLRLLDGFPSAHRVATFYAKGNYFSLGGRQPFTHLVYPLPEAAGLGIHATVDLGGRVRFGPDVEWVDDPQNLAVDPARAGLFEAAIRTYWPGLPHGALEPDYAGIRPKLAPQGSPSRDFLVQDETEHGVPGLLNLLGIESPGLTASLALAERVVRRLA